MDINKIENANKAQLVDLLTTLEDSNQSGKELETVAAKYFHKNLHQPDKQELFQHIKGSSDQIHFIFQINVGKSRIRHRKTLNFESRHFNCYGASLEIHHSMSESFYLGSDSFRH